MTKGNGNAEDGFADTGHVGVVETCFPFFADLNGEVVGEFAVVFIHGMVFCMSVDGGRASVDPDFWGMGNGADGGTEYIGGVDAAVEDGLFVFGGIAAVDRFTSEVNEEVGVEKRRRKAAFILFGQ